MALNAGRDTPMMGEGGACFRFTVAAGATIFPGALVVLDASGDAIPGTVATGLTAAGRAEDGAEAGERITVRRGIFRMKNSGGGDAITKADWGKAVFVVDDETVARTNGSATRSAAGICRGVEAAGVWVEF